MLSSLLQLSVSEWIASNELAFAVRAPRPLCGGHTVVALRRWVPSYSEASTAERAALWALVEQVKAALEPLLRAASYEVGFAMGRAAGEVVPEAAVHVIPRPSDPIDAAPSEKREPPLATGGDRDPLASQLWPLFADATEIAVVAAFVTDGGLALLRPWVFAALDAGASLRVVTGDYLAFTQVDALWQLLHWSQRDARDTTNGAPEAGKLRVRVVQTTQADGAERAFHPKAWLFESASGGAAFVGSSNLTRSALASGVEWNLRVERCIDPLAYGSVRAAVEALWATASDLTAPWIEDYARRVRQSPRPLPAGEVESEPLEPPPEPHEFQQEALAALARPREANCTFDAERVAQPSDQQWHWILD
jgi:HKD family nuclease